MTTKETLRKIAALTDEALLPLWAEIQGAEAGAAQAQAGLDDRRRNLSDRYRASLQARVEELTAKAEELRAEAAPLETIAQAGRWTRFVLVPGGHLHRGFGCSTLRWTTRTGLLPEYSGADEAEIVEIAGEVACTVCFPSAPVDRPTRIPALVEEREAREAEAREKADKKAAAKAQEIRVGRQVFKTQRAAENEIGWKIENYVSTSYMEAADADHRAHLDRMAAGDLEVARTIAQAVAEVVEGYDVDAILAKKFAAKAKLYRKNGWDIPADATL